MEQKNILGLYISQNSASAVLLAPRHTGAAVQGCFTVSVDPEKPASLGKLIRERIDQSNLRFAEVCVCLDCALSTQHDVHSQFTDARQVHSTIKFDVEEALATDATNMVIAPCITDIDDTGSNVTVFCSDAKLLDDILGDMQAGNLDPMTIEPDIICLTRFIEQNFMLPEGSKPLFALLGQNTCYIIAPPGSHHGPVVRSFCTSPSQNPTELLTRELVITIASLNDSRVNSIYIAGNIEQVDTNAINEKTQLDTHAISLGQIAKVNDDMLENCPDLCNFAAAFAAAAHSPGKIKRTDFRPNFSPYMGKRMVIQRTLRVLSVVAAVMLFSLGIQLQAGLSTKKQTVAQLREKLDTEYRAVMFGQPHTSRESYHGKLDRVLRGLSKGTGIGTWDDNSVTSKLTFILHTFNDAMENARDKYKNEIGLVITSMNISDRTMKIVGETNGRKETLALIDAIKKHEKLTKVSENLKSGTPNRDSFVINLELAK